MFKFFFKTELMNSAVSRSAIVIILAVDWRAKKRKAKKVSRRHWHLFGKTKLSRGTINIS